MISNPPVNLNNSLCQLLMPSNTTNGSTVFADISNGGGNTMTGAGTVSHSTAQKQWGTTSILFGGGYVTCSSSLNIGTKDFIVVAWVRPSSLTSYKCLITGHNGGTGQWFGFLAGQMTAYNGTWYTGGTALTLNVWQYVVFSLLAGQLRFFLDGNQIYSVAAAGSFISNGQIRVGSQVNSGANNYAGYGEEYQYVIGRGIERMITPNRAG